MLRGTVTVLLLVLSSCSAYRRLQQWQSLVQPDSRGQDFPEQFLDQLLDHFDATNTK